MDMVSSIYEIINRITNERYVGQAVHPSERWGGHRGALRKGSHHNSFLQKAWDKYGEDVFEFRIVCRCLPKNLDKNEQRVIDSYDFDTLYNVNSKAGSGAALGNQNGEGRKGYKASRETRDKNMRAAKGAWADPKHRKKMLKARADPDYRTKQSEDMTEIWAVRKRKRLAGAVKLAEKLTRKYGVAA